MDREGAPMTAGWSRGGTSVVELHMPMRAVRHRISKDDAKKKKEAQRNQWFAAVQRATFNTRLIHKQWLRRLRRFRRLSRWPGGGASMSSTFELNKIKWQSSSEKSAVGFVSAAMSGCRCVVGNCSRCICHKGWFYILSQLGGLRNLPSQMAEKKQVAKLVQPNVMVEESMRAAFAAPLLVVKEKKKAKDQSSASMRRRATRL